MALEPKTLPANADSAEDNAELRDMTRRFWIGAGLTLPVFGVAMAHLVPAWQHAEWAVGEVSRWGQFLLSTPVVLWFAVVIARRPVRSGRLVHELSQCPGSLS